MHNEQVEQHISEIEGALIRDDPALASRFRLLDGNDARRDRLVFSLLAASMVLLGYGLAMQAGAAFITGGVAFAASFVVDGHYERRSIGEQRVSTSDSPAAPPRSALSRRRRPAGR